MTAIFKNFFLFLALLSLFLMAQNAMAAGVLVRYRTVGEGKAITLSSATDVVRVESEDPEGDLETLRSDPDVVYAEPDYAIQPAALPDDPYLHEGFSYNYETSGIVQAWDLAQDCGGVTVAVIDGGIDVHHPDLKDNLWTNEEEIAGNGLDDDGNGFIDDVHGFDFHGLDGDVDDGFGHGTAVSGIIGAVGNNNVGLSGVCWSVKILPMKIFGDRAGEGGNISSALAAIDYAIDHGATVLNLSWTLEGGESSLFLEEAIRKADEAGVLVVVAAGNEGRDLSSDPVYPAAYDSPNLLTVAAYGFDGEMPEFTNYGKGIVDIAAPGVKILTTNNSRGYFFFNGTSAAAPHVSGAAALILSQDPSLTSKDVAALLKGTADVESGNLNAMTALAALGESGEGDEAAFEADSDPAPSGGGCGLVRAPSEK